MRRSILALLVAGGVFCSACEDDPILKPQQGSKAGGSYSKITIDSAGMGHSGNKPAIDPQTNPERF